MAHWHQAPNDRWRWKNDSLGPQRPASCLSFSGPSWPRTDNRTLSGSRLFTVNSGTTCRDLVLYWLATQPWIIRYFSNCEKSLIIFLSGSICQFHMPKARDRKNSLVKLLKSFKKIKQDRLFCPQETLCQPRVGQWLLFKDGLPYGFPGELGNRSQILAHLNE